MQITLWDWADEGGPGGHGERFEFEERQDGPVARRFGRAEPFKPWPPHYIRIGDRIWAKAWRYCVHAPGDPLFGETEDDFFAPGHARQDP